jgi:hypothetical protein
MLGTMHKPPKIPRARRSKPCDAKDEKANKLTPTSLVTVINRGRELLVRKWDAEDYPLRSYTHNGGTADAPYLMQMPYGAALHFQRHCPIPGTRDPNSNTLAAESFLGILDTDPEEFCAPLTDEQCAAYGQAIEAIERTDGERRRSSTSRRTPAAHRAGGLGNQPRRRRRRPARKPTARPTHRAGSDAAAGRRQRRDSRRSRRAKRELDGREGGAAAGDDDAYRGHAPVPTPCSCRRAFTSRSGIWRRSIGTCGCVGAPKCRGSTCSSAASADRRCATSG